MTKIDRVGLGCLWAWLSAESNLWMRINRGMPKLVLVRHGESQYNNRNTFTGKMDVPLSDKGRQEAVDIARTLQAWNVGFDAAFSSDLIRAYDSLRIILSTLGETNVRCVRTAALNERDYGILTGMDKTGAADKYGRDQVFRWRNSYAEGPPGGESLGDTYARVLPCYQGEIVPLLQAGKSVLVVSHGNTLRSIGKNIERMSDEDVLKFHITTGAGVLYELSGDLRVEEKRLINAKPLDKE